MRTLHLSVTVLAIVLCAGVADAQVPDSGDGPSRETPPIAVWLSAGLGPGNSGRFAGALRATVAVDHAALTYRNAEVGPFFSGGNGVTDHVALAGARVGTPRLFAVAALGGGAASHFSIAGEGGPRSTDAPRAVLAYDLSLHANAVVPGLSIGTFGTVGAGNTTYSAFTVSVELGWFGR